MRSQLEANSLTRSLDWRRFSIRREPAAKRKNENIFYQLLLSHDNALRFMEHTPNAIKNQRNRRDQIQTTTATAVILTRSDTSLGEP